MMYIIADIFKGWGKTLSYPLVAFLAFAFSIVMPSFAAEARSITDVQRRVENGKMFLVVKFDAGGSGDNHALYIAYDTEDKGADISNWAALQRGCVVAAGATTATIPVSPLLTEKGYTFCRVFLTTSEAPYDTLIESLRQSGSQYIDTGIYPDPTTVAVMDTKFDSNATRQQRFFGISSDKTSGDYAEFTFDTYINGDGKFASACKNGIGDWKAAGTFTSDRVQILLSAVENHHVVITNLATETQIADKTWATTCTKTSKGSLFVFAQNYVTKDGSQVANIAKGAYLYSFTMTKDGEPVCDYKPCMLGGRAGVYDSVTDSVICSDSETDFDATNSGSPIACSLLEGEEQVAVAQSATELLSDYVWGGTSANWGGLNAWTKDDESVTWADGNNAVFDAFGATAALDADVMAKRLEFKEDATVSGSDKLMVPTVQVYSGVAATISAPTAGALEKTGAGTLTLAQNRTDATIVTEGMLKMDGATVAGLTLGTDGGAPVAFDYGGQELVKNPQDYLITGSTVTLTNGVFSASEMLQIRDSSAIPAVLTIAKDASLVQGSSGTRRLNLQKDNGTAIINVAGGTLGSASAGTSDSFLQHAADNGCLHVNVTDGGRWIYSSTVYAMCNGSSGKSPSLYMTINDSMLYVGGSFHYGHDGVTPKNPTGVLAATNSIVYIGNEFIIGRGGKYDLTEGGYTADFDNCVVTTKTFAVYYDRQLSNARFNGSRFVFKAAGGKIVASDGEANWFTIGDDGLIIDTQDFAATLNANLGGSGAVTKVGAGTLTVSRNQATTGGFNVSAGTLAPNPGLTFEGPVSVADSATLVINASDTTRVSELSFAAGAKLNIANYDGTLPVNAGTLSLPATGSVKLMLNGGSFGEGVYAICSANNVKPADGEKFLIDFSIADLLPSWSVVDGVLVLTVRATSRTWNGAAGESVSWASGWMGGAWAETHDAMFNTSGAIASVDENVAANSVHFNENAIVNGLAVLTPNVIFVAEGREATVNAPTAGALEKTGAGTLTLAQNRTDATIVTEGMLKMDGATVAGLTLGTAGGAPVAFDYGGQEIERRNSLNYLVTGSTVTLTNGVFSTDSESDLNIRNDTFTMPSILTIAKDAVVRQSAKGKKVYLNYVNGAATINVIGGMIGNIEGCAEVYLQHKSADGRLDINVVDGGLVYFPCTIYALCGNDTARTSPALCLTVFNSAFVGGTFNFGTSYDSDKYVPTNPTGVFAATNSVISIGDTFKIGRNSQVDGKTGGRYTADFEDCTVTAKTFAVYYDCLLNNARFNGSRFVFNAAGGNIVASDDEANWFTVGEDGLIIDTQDYSATLNANLGGSGVVTKVGAGTLTVSRNQTAAGGFNVSAGALALNPGLTFAGSISVADGAKLDINAANTVNVRSLAFSEGSSLNIASYNGTMPLAVSTDVTLPESGTVNLTLAGGAFAQGVYAIYSKSGVTVEDGAKFSFSAADNLVGEWSVADNILILTVGEIDPNAWTGRGGDGKMSNGANWGGGIVPVAGSDIDFSGLTGDTAIIADAGRKFGAVTVGAGVITFTNNLTATSFSDMSKVAVAADSTVTIDSDIIITESSQRLCSNIAAGGKLRIAGVLEVEHPSGNFQFSSSNAAGAVVVEGGIVMNTGSTSAGVLMNVKSLALGENGIAFANNSPFRLINKPVVYALEERIVLGTNGRGLFRGDNAPFTFCTTQFESDQPATITLDARVTGVAEYWAQWAVTGCGRFVTTAASGTNRGWTIEEGVTFSLHPDFDTSIETSGQNYVVSSNATLEVGASGTLYVNGKTLTLADRASLGFNFTERTTAPVFALGSKNTLTVGGAVAVKLSGVRPRAGEHVLTTCGGFDAEGVTVSLAEGAPRWAKGVYVNTDGNIVLDVKPRGMMIIVK